MLLDAGRGSLEKTSHVNGNVTVVFRATWLLETETSLSISATIQLICVGALRIHSWSVTNISIGFCITSVLLLQYIALTVCSNAGIVKPQAVVPSRTLHLLQCYYKQ